MPGLSNPLERNHIQKNAHIRQFSAHVSDRKTPAYLGVEEFMNALVNQFGIRMGYSQSLDSQTLFILRKIPKLKRRLASASGPFSCDPLRKGDHSSWPSNTLPAGASDDRYLEVIETQMPEDPSTSSLPRSLLSNQ